MHSLPPSHTHISHTCIYDASHSLCLICRDQPMASDSISADIEGFPHHRVLLGYVLLCSSLAGCGGKCCSSSTQEVDTRGTWVHWMPGWATEGDSISQFCVPVSTVLDWNNLREGELFGVTFHIIITGSHGGAPQIMEWETTHMTRNNIIDLIFSSFL